MQTSKQTPVQTSVQTCHSAGVRASVEAHVGHQAENGGAAQFLVPAPRSITQLVGAWDAARRMERRGQRRRRAASAAETLRLFPVARLLRMASR